MYFDYMIHSFDYICCTRSSRTTAAEVLSQTQAAVVIHVRLSQKPAAVVMPPLMRAVVVRAAAAMPWLLLHANTSMVTASKSRRPRSGAGN